MSWGETMGYSGVVWMSYQLRAFLWRFAKFVEVGDDRFYDQTFFPFCFGDFDDRCFDGLGVTIGIKKLVFGGGFDRLEEEFFDAHD
jgi:hypothetical protein